MNSTDRERQETITVKGARENNLKDISLRIPRGSLVVVTGVSGSGKSSLAFDTLFAEGQRRFAQSLSSYARQFLGRMSKPDVDLVEGIPPAIAIEQKVSVKNPRSTVATTTEIYDYLRLIFARAGRTYSPVSGKEVRCETVSDVLDYLSDPALPLEENPLYILSDLGWDTRDDKVELMLFLKENGYSRLFIPSANGSFSAGPVTIDDVLKTDGAYPEKALLMVDRLKLSDRAAIREDADLRARLLSSVNDAFREGNGLMYVSCADTLRQFSDRFELDGMRFRKPDDYLFSFNSPLGACPDCGGLGKIIGISEDLVIPDKTKSIYDGAIACWRGEKMGWFRDHLCRLAPKYGINVFEPYCSLSEEAKDIIWNSRSVQGDDDSLVGIREFFDWVETQRYKIQYKYMLSRFSGRTVCSSCHGTRLRREALYVKVAGKNIGEILDMTVEEALAFWRSASFSPEEREIIREPLSEIISRLSYIDEVGLGYLTLSRNMNTLSGGESQRVNLVTALGSSLVGSLYILDEPSIGLHPRDTERLIGVLRKLRDLGNTVLVVEHDEEIIRAADMLIDLGPNAGINGGEIVFQGNMQTPPSDGQIDKSLTLQYITGRKERYLREKRKWNYSITVEGAMEHNLKNIDVRFPLGVLTVVTGVSGSGKSSLVGDILYPALNRRLSDGAEVPGIHRGLSGNLDRISRVEFVDQNPLGRSTRSNAVTYLKVYDEIRKLLASQQYARINGFGPSHFSFNQEGGRCPECQGEGVVKIGMQFMADVTMVCEECGGKRFKPEILEVRYNGKNIDDILDMSVQEAIEFFSAGKEEEAQSIALKLRPLVDVGLGYIKLGQSSSTLSGGESQRVKLAYFLSKGGKGAKGSSEKIMFIFDEPTTGLHFSDVEKLLKSFDELLSCGHTIVVVEHNMDVIKNADWVIDLGPDAGERGGEVVFEGTPEEMIGKSDTFTAKWMRL